MTSVAKFDILTAVLLRRYADDVLKQLGAFIFRVTSPRRVANIPYIIACDMPTLPAWLFFHTVFTDVSKEPRALTLYYVTEYHSTQHNALRRLEYSDSLVIQRRLFKFRSLYMTQSNYFQRLS